MEITETNSLDSNTLVRITDIIEKSDHQGLGKEYFLSCLAREEVTKLMAFNENSLALLLYNYFLDSVLVYDFLVERDEDYPLLEELLDYLLNIVRANPQYNYICIENTIQPESPLFNALQKKEFNLVLRHYMAAEKESWQKELPQLAEDYEIMPIDKADLNELVLSRLGAMEKQSESSYKFVYQDFADYFNSQYFADLSFKVVNRGEICGAILGDRYGNNKQTGLLKELWVSPVHQGKKLGQYLVILLTKELFNIFNKIVLTVTADNKGALNCYLKSGYLISKSVYCGTYIKGQA